MLTNIAIRWYTQANVDGISRLRFNWREIGIGTYRLLLTSTQTEVTPFEFADQG